jgi:hypothetical protein
MAFRLFAFWQLGSASMLLWGLTAAVPLLIHLWARRKYRQEPWAAMAFLAAAIRNSARRVKFQQWLLLVLRTATLLLFAVALADPQWLGRSSGGDNQSAGHTYVILVFDASYSMDFRTDETTRLAVSKKRAAELIERRGRGDGYSLILMAEPPRIVISDPAFDTQQVRSEIDNLQVSHSSANLVATLAEIEALLGRDTLHPGPRAPFTRTQIYFFTDLQRLTWKEIDSTDCQERLARLQRLAALSVIDVGADDESNLAVAHLSVESAAGRQLAAPTEVRFRAEIQSFAREDKANQAVEILVDGQPAFEQRLSIPASGRATMSVAHRFELPGEHVVEARLADDPLLLDNRRWLVVRMPRTIRVLCIGSHPSETKFLALALDPEHQVGGSIEVKQASESHLVEADLVQFDCIFLSNIGRFTREEATALGNYVEAGGGLVVFLGDQVQLDSYNQLRIADQSLLPARLLDPMPAKVEGYRFDPLDYRHPLLAPFQGFTRAGLLTTPVWKYIRATPLEGSSVALAFVGGDPAIVEGRAGRGRCVLVTTAASAGSFDRSTQPSMPWTAWSSWPSFPPLVHEMLRLTLANKDKAHNLIVGDDLAGIIKASTQPRTVTVSSPGAIAERFATQLQGSDVVWDFGRVTTSGIYEAQVGNTTERYAVNLNTRESDLVRFDPQLLPPSFGHSTSGFADQPPSRALSYSNSASRWFLSAVLLLLIAESSVAWHFGRSGR